MTARSSINMAAEIAVASKPAAEIFSLISSVRTFDATLLLKSSFSKRDTSCRELKFIKTNGYQIRTVHIKPRLFYMYTFLTTGFVPSVIDGEYRNKIWHVKSCDH